MCMLGAEVGAKMNVGLETEMGDHMGAFGY